MSFELERSNDHARLLELYQRLTACRDRGPDYYELRSRQRGPKAFFESAFLKKQGKVVGLVDFGQATHLSSPKESEVFLAVDPRNCGPLDLREILHKIESELFLRKFNSIHALTNEHVVKNALEGLGYRAELELVETIRQLPSLKSDEYPVWPPGFQVTAFSKLYGQQGEEIYSNLLEFIRSILMDTPGQQVQAQNLEARLLKESWRGTHFLEDGCLLLEKAGVPIGIHNIVSFADGEVTAGITGILRPFRRRGFMTGLKRHGMIWAAQAGFTLYRSHNEISNPMLRLNSGLGFVEHRRSFELSKSLHANP